VRKILVSSRINWPAPVFPCSHIRNYWTRSFAAGSRRKTRRKCFVRMNRGCVPPETCVAYLEEMLRRGELKTVNEILMKYAGCIGLEAPEARRTTAIGLSELAEIYGSGDGRCVDRSDSTRWKPAGRRTRTGVADINQCGVRSYEPGSCFEALLPPPCNRRWLHSTALKRNAPVRRRACGQESARKIAFRNSSKKRFARPDSRWARGHSRPDAEGGRFITS